MGWKIQHRKHVNSIQLYLLICVGGPQEHIPRRTHRTRHTVIVMAVIYYSKRYKVKSAQRKEALAKFGENQKQASKSPVPVESLRMHLIPPVMRCDYVRKVLSTREAH